MTDATPSAPGDPEHEPLAPSDEARAAPERTPAPDGAPVATEHPAGDAGVGGPPQEAYATFAPVEVVTVAFELPSPSPTIHLRERTSPYRGIDFPIGLPEAQSIAMALEGERPPRPGTHDLLASALRAAGCDVVAVRITAAKAGTLIAELDLMGPRGREVLDCRPTDGIALAVRCTPPAPVLCDVALLV